MEEVRKVTSVDIGDYIVLASGLGFTVTSKDVNPESKVVMLDLKRFDKKSGQNQHSSIAVTEDGFYLKKSEPTINDVVRVSDVTRTAYLTPAGVLSENTPMGLKQELFNDGQSTKVQTRNGFWFNVLSANLDPRNAVISLKLGQLGSVCKERHLLYTVDGKTQKTASALGAYYDPYDIIRVENL